jgi:hypothetical protein
MSEDQIERIVERMFDSLDKKFLKGLLTTEEYRLECKKICDWANQQQYNN